MNCRNEEQKVIQGNVQGTMGKRARLQCPKTKKWRPYTQTLHATVPQILSFIPDKKERRKR